MELRKVRRQTHIDHDNRAFTLIELMVALLMAFIFIGGTIMIIHSNVNAYRAQERVVDVQQESRALLDYMVREIRMAGSDPMHKNIAGIVEASGDRIHFTLDRNANGILDAYDEEEISFEINNGKVSRILYEDTDSKFEEGIVDDVQALSFTYLDKDGNETATIGNIVAVTIKLTKQDRDHKGEHFTRTLTTTVDMRNLSL